MLYPAISYADQLRERFRSIWFKDKYKYWNCDTYYDEWNPDENTWNHHQFASVRDGEVIGYIGYKINRSADSVFGLNIINFEDSPSATFSLDLGRALRDIFETYHFRKLSFCVVIGNPIEKAYDKMIEKYGGRILGIQREHVKLIDGKLYDYKMYEIFRDDYEKSRRHTT